MRKNMFLFAALARTRMHRIFDFGNGAAANNFLMGDSGGGALNLQIYSPCSSPPIVFPSSTACASTNLLCFIRTAVGATCALPTKAPDGQSTTMGRLWVRCRPIALWKMSSCARTILEEATGTWTGSCKENYLSFKFTTVYSQLLKWLLLSCTTVYFTSTHPCAYFSVRKGIIFFV